VDVLDPSLTGLTHGDDGAVRIHQQTLEMLVDTVDVIVTHGHFIDAIDAIDVVGIQ